jgi:hypothetical protein
MKKFPYDMNVLILLITSNISLTECPISLVSLTLPQTMRRGEDDFRRLFTSLNIYIYIYIICFVVVDNKVLNTNIIVEQDTISQLKLNNII